MAVYHLKLCLSMSLQFFIECVVEMNAIIACIMVLCAQRNYQTVFVRILSMAPVHNVVNVQVLACSTLEAMTHIRRDQ